MIIIIMQITYNLIDYCFCFILALNYSSRHSNDLNNENFYVLIGRNCWRRIHVNRCQNSTRMRMMMMMMMGHMVRGWMQGRTAVDLVQTVNPTGGQHVVMVVAIRMALMGRRRCGWVAGIGGLR
jgi:hypothetical protein